MKNEDGDIQAVAPASVIAEEAVDQLQASEKLIAGTFSILIQIIVFFSSYLNKYR